MSEIKEFIAKTYGVVWANKTQLENLEQFAALVRADERDACIKAIEDQIGWDMDDPESTAIAAIRARGQE